MKTTLLAAALLAASTLTLPALADGPGQLRGRPDHDRHERRDDRREHRGSHHHYSPRWNSGRALRDGWRGSGSDYRDRYAYGRCDRRHDHWDGRRYHRTYWDARGFLYYWDGDLVIRLRAW